MDIQQHINEELKMEKEPTNNTKVMEEFEKRFVGRNGLVYSGELTAGKIKQFLSEKLKEAKIKTAKANGSMCEVRLDKQKKELIEKELEILKRLQLDFNVIECDCGEEWKGSDPHVVVNERIDKLDSLIN